MKTDDFHNWVEEQPNGCDKLYMKMMTMQCLTRAIDLYKADRNIGRKRQHQKTAHLLQILNHTVQNLRQRGVTYLRESQVQKMSSQEYERRADEVMEAIRTGKFVYDVFWSAR